MTLLSHQLLLSQTAATSLYAAIMADSPVNYWRCGEPSGTVMIDQVAANGAYTGAVSLGNPAIYPGAGAGTTITNFASTRYGQSTAFPVALNAISLVAVVSLTTVVGIQIIGAQRDQNAGGRKWQLRSNGTTLQFVKIVGGVVVVQQTGVFVAGVACIIGVTVDVSGNWALYKNGVLLNSGTIAAADYGGAGDPYRIGFASGPAVGMNGFVCECAVFGTALSGARMATYASIAGL